MTEEVTHQGGGWSGLAARVATDQSVTAVANRSSAQAARVPCNTTHFSSAHEWQWEAGLTVGDAASVGLRSDSQEDECQQQQEDEGSRDVAHAAAAAVDLPSVCVVCRFF